MKLGLLLAYKRLSFALNAIQQHLFKLACIPP